MPRPYEMDLEDAAAAVSETDPNACNRLAVDLAIKAAEAEHEAETQEIRRPALFRDLQAQYMAPPESLNQTKAEAAVRQDSRYTSRLSDIADHRLAAAELNAWARYFCNRVQILCTAAAGGPRG